MKAKQLLILFSAVGLVLWVYFLYKSIPFASHINLKTIKMILDLTFDMQNIITPAGFLLSLIMALINQKTVAAVGGIISLIMPLYTGISDSYFETSQIATIIFSVLIIVVGLFYKNLKLK